jgi:cytochrome bd-type quinol oxidase subunit 2
MYLKQNLTVTSYSPIFHDRPRLVNGEDAHLSIEAASAPSSLMIMLVGSLIVLRVLFGYTILAYVIFHGKAKDLSYS